MRGSRKNTPAVARSRSWGWLALCFGVAVSVTPADPPAAWAGATTIVSLGFDDTWASHHSTRALLARHRMKATFFVNTGLVGQHERMTWSQIRDLAKDGHEIGGHALTHADLQTLEPAARRREVCDDRVALLGHGIRATSFAYPFGRLDSTTRAIVRECGYNSARAVGGIQCTGCPAAETLPPADVFATRTELVHSTTTLEALKGFVTKAERSGGGWVQIVFHQICDGCGMYGVSEPTLARFIEWLAARKAAGTDVRPVRDVIGGEVAPVATVRPGPDTDSD